jgi:hypothetical protein
MVTVPDGRVTASAELTQATCSSTARNPVMCVGGLARWSSLQVSRGYKARYMDNMYNVYRPKDRRELRYTSFHVISRLQLVALDGTSEGTSHELA